jgi:hypothetical protein
MHALIVGDKPAVDTPHSVCIFVYPLLNFCIKLLLLWQL